MVPGRDRALQGKAQGQRGNSCFDSGELTLDRLHETGSGPPRQFLIVPFAPRSGAGNKHGKDHRPPVHQPVRFFVVDFVAPQEVPLSDVGLVLQDLQVFYP